MRCRTGCRNAESVVPMQLSLSCKQFSLQTVEPSASVQRRKCSLLLFFSTLIKGKLASLALRFLSGKSPVLGTCLLSPFLFYHFTFLRPPPCFVFLPFSPQIQSPVHSLSLVLLPIFRGTCWMPELKTLN